MRRVLTAITLLAVLPSCRLAAQETMLRVTLSLDRTTAAPGDTVRATLVATNTSRDSVDIMWTSGQQYDFQLLGPRGQALWNWASDMMFTQAIQTRALAPGEQLVYSATVPMPPAAGRFRIVGVLTIREPQSASVPIVVR